MNFQDSPSNLQTRIRDAVTATPSRRTAFIVAGILAVLLVGLYAFTLVREQMVKDYLASNKPPPVPVNTVVLTPQTIPQFQAASGSITAVHQVAIAPEVAGSVVKIAFEAGGTVKKGDLLVQLNDGPEQGELGAARARLRLAQVALDRANALIESGFVSRAQLDQAQSQHDAAAADIVRYQALVDQKHIRAPFDGVLGVRQTEVGHYLNAGATITWLTQTSRLYINFTLPEQAQPRLIAGQDVTFTVDAYPGRTFTAQIAVIDPQVMAETRTVRVQAITDNPDNALAAGMFANVKVVMPPRNDVLLVPETSINYTIGGESVYVVREETDPATNAQVLKAYRTEVQAGERINNQVVVTGLKAGDRVVTSGQNRLFEGGAVTLSPTPPPVTGPLPLN